MDPEQPICYIEQSRDYTEFRVVLLVLTKGFKTGKAKTRWRLALARDLEKAQQLQANPPDMMAACAPDHETPWQFFRE